MKQQYICFFLLLASLSFTGCATAEQSEVEVVNLMKFEPSDVNMSEFTKGMKVVALETSKASLIGMAHSIKFAKDRIFVRDGMVPVILVFDRSGRFIQKLHKEGRGPGEYLDLRDYLIDEEEQTIELLDGTAKKILVYDLASLNFIKEFPLPISTVFRFEKNKGVYYFHTHGLRSLIDGVKSNSDVVAYDRANDKLVALFDRVLPDEANRSFSINGFSTNQTNQLFFSKAWHEQFYLLENMEAKPIFAVEAGIRGIPIDIKNGSYEQQEEFVGTPGMSKDRYMFFMLSYYHKGDVVLFFTNGVNPYDVHYYMRLGEKEFVSRQVNIDYVEGTPTLEANRFFVAGNQFATAISPDQELPEGLLRYLNNIGVKPGDNPTLFLFELN